MVENQILPRYELGAEVLKVGHHGSKYASSQQFLEEVLPKYAIISVGKNSYGHPTQDVLGRLSQVGAQVFRTDIDQSLRFTSDGFSLSKQ
jgi:beta-lactamase superfamily II metal-dependent hydrolase